MAADDIAEVESWVRQRVLGSGGFGVVTLWKNKKSDQMIAIKNCRSGTDVLLSEKHKERWSKEVEIMQRLCHPNVVRALEVPSELTILRSELPLLCMEFCSKGDLRQILNRSENCCGLRESDVRDLISDVKSAVQYLHSKKITHRDLKPENIVLQQVDKKIVYKLIDLGYAKELDQSSFCTSFVGTLQYLAPELFMSKTYTNSVDYWSLGLVSHEVITGVRPFLPNMPPAAWMAHVKQKSSDDISAYENYDGKIVFCQELYEQNRISNALKREMERWLKLALEWDPKKRGRTSDSTIVVFDLLEEILNKKVIHVYVVPYYKNLSYCVNSMTTLCTMQTWIEGDTGLSIQQQELLLASGDSVESDQGALQCWDADCVKNGSPMLFVYEQGKFFIPQVTPHVPKMVSLMMEAPYHQMEYHHQKRAYAHAVFFLQQECSLYQTFVQSYRVKMVHIDRLSREVGHHTQAAYNRFQQVEAQLEIVTSSLHLDSEFAIKAKVAEENIDRWTKCIDAIKWRINKIGEVVRHLQGRCESATARLNNLKQVTKSGQNVLNTLAEEAINCYDDLRRRPRENRRETCAGVKMVKIVYNCLKQRDSLLRDQIFQTHLEKLQIAQIDLEQLTSPLTSALQLLDKVALELQQTQLDRQKDIWALVTSERRTSVPLVEVKSELLLPIIPRSRSQSPAVGTSTMESQSRETTPTPQGQNASFVFSLTETSDMIRDNQELRYITQELMTKSFQEYLTVMNENRSLDWTHLEQ